MSLNTQFPVPDSESLWWFELATKEVAEARVSKGLKLLLGDPTVASWILGVYKDSGDVGRAVTGFVNHELDPDNLFTKPDSVKLRVIAPKHPEIYRSRYITKVQLESIMSLMAARAKRFGRHGHSETVGELPDEVRGSEAIPAVISEILRQLEEGHTLEDLRKRGALDIGTWNINIG